MNPKLGRGQFLAAGAGLGALALPRPARAERFANRYQFACEMTSEFAFLVDAPNNPLSPHPSIAAQVRAGTLKQRERIEFPYGGDILRSLAYYEDPNKPFSAAANAVPENDPRILIEIFTDVTSILVKKDPFTPPDHHGAGDREPHRHIFWRPQFPSDDLFGGLGFAEWIASASGGIVHHQQSRARDAGSFGCLEDQ